MIYATNLAFMGYSPKSCWAPQCDFLHDSKSRSPPKNKKKLDRDPAIQRSYALVRAGMRAEAVLEWGAACVKEVMPN